MPAQPPPPQPTEEPDLLATLRVIETVLGIAITLWLCWTMLDAVQKQAVLSRFERFASHFKSSRDRQHEAAILRWEIFQAEDAIEDYNASRDRDRLADDLDVA